MKSDICDDNPGGRSQKVQILMSTYNGEEFIREQLDSVLAQNYPDVDIWSGMTVPVTIRM